MEHLVAFHKKLKGILNSRIKVDVSLVSIKLF